MRCLARLALLVVVGLVLCVGMSQAIATSGSGEGRSLANSFLYEVRRAEALRNCSNLISHAQEAKHTIISDLLAQKLTAQEATKQFAAVDESLAEESSKLMPYRGPRTEEGVRRQLLGWVKSELAANPQQAEEAACRVEEELAEASADTQ